MEMEDKAEYYTFLVEKVYKKYLTISIKNQQSIRFKLLLAMLIVGSKNCMNYLKAFHFLSDWFWIKDKDPSIIKIMIEILRYYLIQAMDYYENNDNDDNDYYMCNIINKVLSETLLCTFNDKQFEKGVRRMKLELLNIVSVKNRKLLLNEMKTDEMKLNQFCEYFDNWIRNIFKVVSKNDQYCFDSERWIAKDVPSSSKKRKLYDTPQRELEENSKYNIHSDIEVESYDVITEFHGNEYEQDFSEQQHGFTLDATPLNPTSFNKDYSSSAIVRPLEEHKSKSIERLNIYQEETKENDDDMSYEEESDKEDTKEYENEVMMKQSEIPEKQIEKRVTWWSETINNLCTSMNWEDYDSTFDSD